MGRLPGGLGVEGPRLEAHIKDRLAIGVHFPQLMAFPAPSPRRPAPAPAGQPRSRDQRPRERACVPAGAAARSGPSPGEFPAPFGGGRRGAGKEGRRQDPTTSESENLLGAGVRIYRLRVGSGVGGAAVFRPRSAERPPISSVPLPRSALPRARGGEKDVATERGLPSPSSAAS